MQNSSAGAASQAVILIREPRRGAPQGTHRPVVGKFIRRERVAKFASPGGSSLTQCRQSGNTDAKTMRARRSAASRCVASGACTDAFAAC